MNKKNLNIFELEHVIERQIILSDDDLPERIQKLRRYTFYAHTVLEKTLSLAIIKTLLERANPDPSFSQLMFFSWANFLGYVHDIFDNYRYTQKVETLSKLKAFDNKWIQKLIRLNKLRNILAHTKDLKYQKIDSDEKYETALKLIKDTLEISKELDSRFDKAIFPEGDDFSSAYKEFWGKYLE